MNKIDLKDILQENLADDNQDYLSILGDEKEMLNDHTDIPDTLPILPLRNTVLFPGVIIPINIGREKSLKLIRYVYKSSVPFGVIAQRDLNLMISCTMNPITWEKSLLNKRTRSRKKTKSIMLSERL